MTQAQQQFTEKMREFIQVSSELVNIWQDNPEIEVENYPSYLPSFDEFMADMQEVKIIK